jgi:hypothetical protein
MLHLRPAYICDMRMQVIIRSTQCFVRPEAGNISLFIKYLHENGTVYPFSQLVILSFYIPFPGKKQKDGAQVS